MHHLVRSASSACTPQFLLSEGVCKSAPSLLGWHQEEGCEIRGPLRKVSSRSGADCSSPGKASCYLNCKPVLFLPALHMDCSLFVFQFQQ